MKRIIFAIFAVLVLVPFTARAEFQVPKGVKTVEAPAYITAPAPTSSSLSMSDVTAAVKSGIGSVNATVANKLNAWKKADETKRTAENAAIQGQYSSLKGEVRGNITALDKKLTNTKDGEFKKLNDSVWSAGKEFSKSVNSDLKWVAFWVILAVILVGVGVALFLKKSLNRIEEKVDVVDEKVDEIPADTAERVLAFDRSPLNVVAGGHNVVFLQDADTLNRRVYQTLLVEDGVDPADTPATYELQTTARRDKAEDSLQRTMREYFNGKLIAKTDSASVLTVNLIKHYESTGKLSIVKLP